MFSDVITEAFKAENINIEVNELDKVGALINKEINAVIPKVVSGVEEKIREGCFDSVFRDAGRTVSNSWAEIARNDQNKIIKEAVRATTDVALQQSMQLLDSNLTERKKRSRNMIISNVPENSEGANLSEVICRKLGEGLRPEHILSSKRLGKRRDRSRAILCILYKEDDVVFFTNDGKGRKFPGEIWVNPDLTRTEREALYQRRMEKRSGRRRNNAEQPPLIDLEAGNHSDPTISASDNGEQSTRRELEPASVNNNQHQPSTDTQVAHQPPATVSNEHLNGTGVGNGAGQ